MRILFSMRHPGALKNFSSTLQALALRGHQIHLVFGHRDRQGDGRLLSDLTRDFPGITSSALKRKTPWRFWLGLGRVTRYSVDFVRYLTPEYDGATSLTDRARSKVGAPMRWIGTIPFFRSRAGNRLLTRLLVSVDRAIPVDRLVVDLMEAERPDVVLVTPLVDIGSDQVEYVKAARRLGIRSALPVHSWDNLTNKGLIRIQPDQVYVWNEAQKDEAVRLHGTRPEHVVVTGAMVYDQWFARRPSTAREEFCARAGLDAARPFFLYLCSSRFIAPDEVRFIETWIGAVRAAADGRVRTAGILVRPHPENLQPWHRFDEMQLEDVVVWPGGGASPIDSESKNAFYDSMYHAAGAVGINTSAQIECGIVGRPVFSIRTPEYHRSQEGTLHFRYLLSEGGGLLRIADDFDTHVQQLAQALDDPDGTRRQLEDFVKAFTRPAGLDVDATPRMVEAIERLGAMSRRSPEPLPLHLYPLRALLYPAGLLLMMTRRFTRLSRKRRRQLRPLTFMGTLVQALLNAVDWVFRLQPVRTFVKRYILPRVIPRLSSSDAPSEEAIAVPRLLNRMTRSGRTIIVGPWVSEIGFEVLYWIPFLNWVKTHRALDAERIVVVSRGGCGAWYRDIGARYVDLFDYYTPEQYREGTEQRITDGKAKARTMTEFDRDILKLVRQTLQLRDSDLLHPMWMYRLFDRFWKSRAPIEVVEKFTVFRPLPSIDTSDIAAALPDDYVAVRFYFNEAFPETDVNRRLVAGLLGAIAETTDVVMLNPGIRLDQHVDVDAARRGRIHSISHLMTPRTNLDVQTKVIARARAFVGTHGGLSYLPPLYGVKSLAFYSDTRSHTMRHLELARRAFGGMNPGSYVALDVDDLETLGVALGEQHEAIAGIARRSVS